MTNTPDTAPEAVERMARLLERGRGDVSATLRALSAALGAEKRALAICEDERGQWERHCKSAESRAERAEKLTDEMVSHIRAAEAERDALKAELAEAVALLRKSTTAIDELTSDNLGTLDYKAIKLLIRKTRASLARHQKETGG